MIKIQITIILIILTMPALLGCSTYVPSDEFIYKSQSTVLPYQETETAQPHQTPEAALELIIKQAPEIYTYIDLEDDISILQKKYNNIIQVTKICETFDERSVYDIVIGDLDSENHILIMGAMHAREYITTQIVMRQLCNCLENLTGEKTDEYNGEYVTELMDNVAIHFIPMVNPDGVSISQFGIEGLKTQTAKDRVTAISEKLDFTDYEQWKSNAEGTDINRNFDAGWEEYNDNVGEPAPDYYKGINPGSSAEADGIIRLTENYSFKRTISYHTKGNLIYWYYKQTGETLEQSEKFAQAISDVTGYYLDGDYTTVDAAGYKDWAVYKKGIPSITIEVGGSAPDNPVPYEYFPTIWNENKDVVWTTLYDLKYLN